MLGVKTKWGRDLLVIVLNVTEEKEMQEQHQEMQEKRKKSFSCFLMEKQANKKDRLFSAVLHDEILGEQSFIYAL